MKSMVYAMSETFFKNHRFWFPLFFLFAVGSNFASAEGTKELRPAEKNTGSLHLSNKAQFTRFGQYGAIGEQQIRFRIADLHETIYFGITNEKESGGFVSGIPYRIVSPSGKAVFESVMQSSGQGVIRKYSEIIGGPKQLGNPGGYDAKIVKPSEIGDYVLEFDLSVLSSKGEIQIPLFDITVADSLSKPIQGRLYSKGWQLSTQEDSAFYGKVYPLTREGIVYEVDMNRIRPYTFVITFNSKGTGNTGNFTLDRKSRVGNFSFPEYSVFLNPPDEKVFPYLPGIFNFKGISEKDFCRSDNYCLKFSVSQPGLLEGFVDMNNNGVHDVDGSDYTFSNIFNNAGEKCVSWNKKNDSGVISGNGNYMVYASFAYGLINFPIYDAEHNEYGFKIKIVRPFSQELPRLFWDDSDITTGSTLGEPLVNLSGCISDSGCHKWKDRGNFDDDSQETINTWWYSSLHRLSFQIDTVPVFRISSALDSLVIPPSTCISSLSPLFVFQKSAAFDTLAFRYTWQTANRVLAVNKKSVQIKDSTITALKLTIKSLKDSLCTLQDSLKLNRKLPVSFSIHPLDCGVLDSRVRIIPAITEKDFFVVLDSAKTEGLEYFNLSPGNHHIKINSSAGCNLDTSFSIPIKKPDFKIVSTPEYCGQGNGTVHIVTSGSRTKVKWSDSESTDRYFLKSGKYAITITDPASHFCTVDTVITIINLNEVNKHSISIEPEVVRQQDLVFFDVLNGGENWMYQWSAGDGTTNFNRTFTHRYNAPGEYTITLNVTDDNGCISQLNKVVNVSEQSECMLKVPNAFSPNGDGSNDVLSVLGMCYSFELTICNRAGAEVFRTRDQKQKWDGTFRGSELPVSSYPYILKYNCLGSNNQLYSKQETGDISILR